MKKYLINRSSFTTAAEKDLLPFVQNCLGRTKNNPAYAAAESAIQVLDTKAAEYAQALAAAENKGRDAIVNKRKVKQELVEAMNRLATLFELHANGDPTYVANAGLVLRQPSHRVTGGLGLVGEVKLALGKKSGEAVVEFTAVPGARLYAVEWDDSGQDNWQPGYFSTARRVVIAVPAQKFVRVRVRALGQHDRHGGWTASPSVYIL